MFKREPPEGCEKIKAFEEMRYRCFDTYTEFPQYSAAPFNSAEHVFVQLQAVHIGTPLLLPWQKQSEFHPNGFSFLSRQTPWLFTTHPCVRARGRRGQQGSRFWLWPTRNHVILWCPYSGVHEHQHRWSPRGACLTLRDIRVPDRQPGHQLDLSRAGLCLWDVHLQPSSTTTDFLTNTTFCSTRGSLSLCAHCLRCPSIFAWRSNSVQNIHHNQYDLLPQPPVLHNKWAAVGRKRPDSSRVHMQA